MGKINFNMMKNYFLTAIYRYLKRRGIQEADKLNIGHALCFFWAATTIAWDSNVNIYHDKEVDKSLHGLGFNYFGLKDLSEKHSKVRIAYITSGILPYGGLTQHIENIIKFHDKDSFEIYLYSTECSFGGGSKLRAKDRVSALNEEVEKLFIADFDSSLLEKADSVVREIEKDEVDVLAYFLAPNDVVSSLVASCFRNYKNIFFHDSSHVFCLGSFQFDLHIDTTKKFFLRCKDENINHNVIHLPLPGRAQDNDKLVGRALREKCGLSDSSILAATIGNPQKNVWDNNHAYIEITGELLTANENLYLLLVADGMQHIRNLLVDRFPNIAERVFVEKSTPKVCDLLKECDMYFSSFPVGGGLAILDAISVGLPVVSVESQREILQCDEIIACDKEDYISVANRLVQDIEFRNNVAQKVSSVYRENFDPRKIVRQIEEIYLTPYTKNFAAANKGTLRLELRRTRKLQSVLNFVRKTVQYNSLGLRLCQKLLNYILK